MSDEDYIKVVSACSQHGEPRFFACEVRCSRAQYKRGRHYEAARDLAEERGFSPPFVHFDEKDGPAWLFQQFDWIGGPSTTVME